MKVSDLYTDLQAELKWRKYFADLIVLEQTLSLLKARLLVSADLFVQVYRNDQFHTTNLALIHNGQRLFARDELDGHWHRHAHISPEEHDTSSDGCKPVTLAEFLDEVEQVLAELDLP
jgi:hypothetical protein